VASILQDVTGNIRVPPESLGDKPGKQKSERAARQTRIKREEGEWRKKNEERRKKKEETRKKKRHAGGEPA